MITPNKTFAVRLLNREDIKKECPNIDADNLTDEQMERLADKMGDALADDYWSALRACVRDLNLPTKE